jgi:hypothetical protein
MLITKRAMSFCLLVLSPSLYAQEETIQKLDDMVVSAPFIESVEDSSHPITLLKGMIYVIKWVQHWAKHCKMNWA